MRALYILFNALGSDERTYFELKMNANISPKTIPVFTWYITALCQTKMQLHYVFIQWPLFIVQINFSIAYTFCVILNHDPIREHMCRCRFPLNFRTVINICNFVGYKPNQTRNSILAFTSRLWHLSGFNFHLEYWVRSQTNRLQFSPL